MKKINILFLALLAALASCKKTEVNVKYVEITQELVTPGVTTANIQCDYNYITTLKKAFIYYGIGEDESNMTSAEMQVVQSSLYVELTGLSENTTYGYYYEFVNGFNSMRSTVRTFKTDPSPVTPPEITVPTVVTAAVTEITTDSAKSGGEVTNDGGAEVTERGICWSTSANPAVTDNHIAVGTGIGEFIVTITGLEANATYHVRAYAINEKGTAYGLDKEFTTLSNGGGGGGDHDCVDLGLPSGTLWATCNVGANTPEEYGDYFAWGETTPKTIYNWSTYKYCNGGEGFNTLTKYCNYSEYGYNGFTDNLRMLQSSDDAATANWGNEWYTPTYDQWLELYQNTTQNWTTQNGVNGRLFTAANGNSLFLPATGALIDSSPHNPGIGGDYHSSSLFTEQPSNEWGFGFSSYGYNLAPGSRSYGFSVRPVCSGQNFQSYTINVSVSPSNGGSVLGSGTYKYGQNCTLTAIVNEGYAFAFWTENGEVVSTEATYTFVVTDDRSLVANFMLQGDAPTGAINGLFTINENGDQVYFSQGNLQYQASTNTWRFSENQWECVGNDNGNISSTYSGWIDLFGYGTSGWNNGNTYYQPYNYESNYISNTGYGYGPTDGTNYVFDLTGIYANADWGVYNSISNGGNAPNQWHTLSKLEWDYIFRNRSTTSGAHYAKAKVNNVNGVILLPDNWDISIFPLNNTDADAAPYTVNNITTIDWMALEARGAVFLSAAGSRNSEPSVNYYNEVGCYHSSSVYSSHCSGNIFFDAGNVVSFGEGYGYYYQRDHGYSVRLVQDANRK